MTKGPWHINPKPSEDEAYMIVSEPGANSCADDPVGVEHIACVYDGNVTGPGPNARLISAAPDLYTALKEIVEHPAAFHDGANRLWTQALAAIAKAEGTSL